MKDFHSLLLRQIRKTVGDDDKLPDSLRPLIELVNQAYRQSDTDRTMLERSLELTSQEMMQLNADIRAVLEGLLDQYYCVDESGTILYSRQGSPDAHYRPEEQTRGRKIQDMPDPEVSEQYNDALARVKQTHAMECFEYRLKKDGKPMVYEARFVPLHNAQIAVIIRNVTENRLAREREQELNKRLARSERMESLGILAGGVAHDLNNILSPLVAYPDIILHDLPDDHPSRRLIVQMRNSTVRASAIIQDMLALARRGNYKSEPVSLNNVITTYIQSADFAVLQNRNPGTTFSTDLKDDLPLIEGAGHHVSQSVMNLVTNAYEAIENGGRVKVSTDVVEVDQDKGNFDTITKGRYVRLSVSDNGIGLDREELDHIFEPFYSKKRMGQSGTGLGLSVVYGMVKDCNGHIDVQSRPGDGSRFDLYFPASSVSGTVAVSPTESRDITGNEHLLVVDDIKEQRELAQQLLSRLGYRIFTAANGREAVDWLRSNHADLILLDMIMEPDYDGLQTYRDMLTFRPGQRCIIVSGYAETDNVKEALKLGASNFVRKPYTMAILGRAIREALI